MIEAEMLHGGNSIARIDYYYIFTFCDFKIFWKWYYNSVTHILNIAYILAIPILFK